MTFSIELPAVGWLVVALLLLVAVAVLVAVVVLLLLLLRFVEWSVFGGQYYGTSQSVWI